MPRSTVPDVTSPSRSVGWSERPHDHAKPYGDGAVSSPLHPSYAALIRRLGLGEEFADALGDESARLAFRAVSLERLPAGFVVNNELRLGPLTMRRLVVSHSQYRDVACFGRRGRREARPRPAVRGGARRCARSPGRSTGEDPEPPRRASARGDAAR